MDVGYATQCKICNCEHRAQVESMRQEGASLQRIVDWLAERELSVSRPAVKRHFDVHFQVKNEVAARYARQSAEVMQQAVEKRLTDLEMLDAMIERNYRMHALATESITDSLTTDHVVFTQGGMPVHDPVTGDIVKRKFPPPKSIVDLAGVSAGEARQAMKLKDDLLVDKEDPTLNVRFVDDLDDDG